ncbi:MAG: hypothetical protein Q9218_007447 [Villophora microphyllina]
MTHATAEYLPAGQDDADMATDTDKIGRSRSLIVRHVLAMVIRSCKTLLNTEQTIIPLNTSMDPSQLSPEAKRAYWLDRFHAELPASTVLRGQRGPKGKEKIPTWMSSSEQRLSEARKPVTEPDHLAKRLKSIELGTWPDDDYLPEWVPEEHELWWEANMTISVRVLLRLISLEMTLGLLPGNEVRMLLMPDRSLDRELLQRGQAPSFDVETVREAIFGCLNPDTEQTKPASSMNWSPWFVQIRQWLLRRNRPPSDVQRQHLLYRLQQCRAHVLFQYCFGGHNSVEKIYIQWCLVNETVAAFKDLVQAQETLDKRMQTALGPYSAKWHNALAVVAASDWCLDHNPPYRFLITPPFRIHNERFQSTVSDMSEFEQQFKQIGDLRNLCESRIMKVRLIFNRCILYTTEMGLFYDKVEIAEMACNQMRLEAGAAKISGSFLAKALVVRSNNLQLMYRIALSQFLTHQEGDGPDCNCCVLDDEYKVFEWVQKSKTRALNDLMGIAASEQPSINKPIEQNKHAMKLLAMEKALEDEFERTSSDQTRKELDRLRKRMRQTVPVLRPFLDMRYSSSITPKSFQDLAEDLDNNVVIFEWAHCRYDHKGHGDMFLLVYKQGRVCDVGRLPIKLQKVAQWIDRLLDNSARPLSEEGDAGELQELEALVEPVLRFSNPGDTLVFCPTLQLHRIPLHAMSPRGELLTGRNPIHYCQSLSLLRLCEFTNNDCGADSPFQASVFNTLKNASGSLGTRRSAYHIDEVAQMLLTKTVQQHEITKPSLRQRAADSCVLHVHGHIGFDLENPLKNHLVLRDPPENDEDRYTLDEIFDTPLHRPCLVVAMGCNSGRSGDFEYDNLLGLLAAFHYSGASSVISTLWKVHPADCMRFSKAFYKHLMADMEDTEPDSDYVDVAVAFQKAVLAAQKDEKGEPLPPYKWAGFYLHGAGRMPRFNV